MFLPQVPSSIKITFAIVVINFCVSCQADAQHTQRLSFRYQDLQYSGLIEYPATTPSALVILVPGHGKTDLVNGHQLRNERNLFISLGLTVVVWDRAGCGDSEGKYDHEQSIAFWISVGGTDQYETFPYLLERNFRLQGSSKAETLQNASRLLR